MIRDELEAHDPALLAKPTLVAFNKIDRPAAAEAWPAFREARRRDGLPCVAISAATGDGIAELRTLLAELLPEADELGLPPEPAGVVVHRIESLGDGFVVEHEDDGAYRVRGRRIERIAAQTDFERRGIGRAVPARPRPARHRRRAAPGRRRAGDTVRIGVGRARVGPRSPGRLR